MTPASPRSLRTRHRILALAALACLGALSVSAAVDSVAGASTVPPGLGNGSVLFVIAAGMTIIYGLVGVINLAQGELVTLGAYTAYLVQNVIRDGVTLSPFGHPLQVPGLHLTGLPPIAGFLFALPFSFGAAALLGLLLEVSVIRHFYRRPLEGLIASWGLSFILLLLLREVFGNASALLSSPVGLPTAQTDILFPSVAAGVALSVWLLLKHTSFGLVLRAVTQNPVMASCIGVRPKRVNALTFALGSGLGGVGGALLAQAVPLSPELGQGYLTEGCLVVVFAGVGNILGVLIGGLGFSFVREFAAGGWLGLATVPLVGPVGRLLARAPQAGAQLVLVAGLLVFLQWRPAGLFAVGDRKVENSPAP